MGTQSIPIVKELAGAVFTQSQVANRYWIALMAVALFALLPRVGPSQTQTIDLPLGLGAVEPASLHPALFALLVVLIVAFAAAHAQQVRAQKLAQAYIDKMTVVDGELHPRELFDMLRQPSVIRVAPLAQSLRGKYQFFGTAGECPAALWWGSVVYYGVLKLASIGISFLLPGWALCANSKKAVRRKGSFDRTAAASHRGVVCAGASVGGGSSVLDPCFETSFEATKRTG